jgi:4-amino-4-deoxy-L-arabinose transferase-like glycosyltransferase
MIWAILLFLVLTWFLIDLKGTWRNAQGYEYEWVAQSLANGFGYSFDAQHRWLFPDLNASPDNRYYPTAWVEPGYTLIMAGIFKLFGQEGRLVLIIIQTILWYITALIIVYLAMRVFNFWTGILAGLLLVFTPAIRVVAQQSLGNVMMAGLMVMCFCALILWCLEKVSPLREYSWVSGWVLRVWFTV